MSSLLIVTADPNSADALERIARDHAYRHRTVAELSTAKEWLVMQNFDSILIDSRYGDRPVATLLELCWQQNPMCSAGVFNLYQRIPAGMMAQLLGAQIFSGTHALTAIRQMLESFPQRIPNLGAEQLAVLVVEDLDAPRDIIRSYIEAMTNATVEAVDSVDEALSVLKQNPDRFYCVLTDYNMPQRTGLELIEEMRKSPRMTQIPVIVLTAYSTADNLVECIKAGATGFLVKPPKKKLLRFELEKSKRLYLSRQSPRLCEPEEAHLLEDAITRIAS